MSTVLDLQRLTPTVSATDFNLALASSVSSVCPEKLHSFELD